MNYREATRDDIFAIAILHATSWQFAYRGAFSDEYLDGPVVADRLARWQGRLTSPAANQYIIVAKDEGEIGGFACAFGADDERWGTLLDNIHVRRDIYRRGVGARLLTEVGRWSLANYPGAGMYLWVLEKNARAQAFYKRLGATDAEGAIWDSPDGGKVRSRRYVWAPEQVAGMSNLPQDRA